MDGSTGALKDKLIERDNCGYRKHHFTTDQLTYVKNAMQNNFSKRKHVVAVFIDLENAFNKTFKRHNTLRILHD